MIQAISLWLLPLLLITILTLGLFKKVPLYETFIDGAKDGFKVSVSIIPYLVAIIVGISMFRACGIIEIIQTHFGSFLAMIHVPSDVIPVMIVRPLSGSAALGVFSDIAHSLGPDSYATKLAAVMVGSSETTMYVLAVYFGAVGIFKLRYALLVGLLCDVIGFATAIAVCSFLL